MKTEISVLATIVQEVFMYTKLLEKMKTDTRVTQAIKAKKKQAQKKLFMYAAGVFVFALLLCVLAEFNILAWIITWIIAATAIVVPFFVLMKKAALQEIFWGKIARMEEDREIVPRKGSGAAFGTSHKYALAEVYKLLVAITDDGGATKVIFCPPQYEKVFEIGDTLLYHSALPYPAHLSNPTKCICMHCGTMQSSENSACITCGADMYSLHTVNQ